MENFPVSNKPTSILKGVNIILILVVIFGTFYIQNQSIGIIIAFLIVILPTIIYFLIFLKKQNIKSLQLSQNKLLVAYTSKTIEIPISQIHEISDAISFGFDLKFHLVKTYTIQLNTKHLFGRRLFIDYTIDNSKGTTIKNDPIPIKILKAEIKSSQDNLS